MAGIIQWIKGIDVSILRFVNGTIHTPFLTAIFIIASLLGVIGAVWIVIAVVLALRRHDHWARRTAAEIGMALVFDLAVVEGVIKTLFSRTRPFAALPGVITSPITIYTKTGVISFQLADATHSFPSGHAFSAFACAVVLSANYPKFGVWVFLSAAIIAVSRVYLGVHYPSDIFSGAVMGMIVGWLIVLLGRKVFPLNQTPACRACE